jgi:hypothetical protein
MKYLIIWIMMNGKIEIGSGQLPKDGYCVAIAAEEDSTIR